MRTDAYWQEFCRNIRVGNTNFTKEEFFETMWKRFEPTATKIQTEMENKKPDVKFFLEAFVGSLTTVTVEGDHLFEDHNVVTFNNRTWAVASPIDS